MTKQGAKLVEIAARLGGDFITSKLVPLSTGVDLIDCCISSTLGQEVKWESTKESGSAIRFLHLAEAEGDITGDGIIRDITGVEEAKKMPGVSEISIYKSVGDKAGSLKNSGDRWGHVIAIGKDADEAAANAENAAHAIRFILENA